METLHEDRDFRVKVTRESLETFYKDLYPRFDVPFEEAINTAGISKSGNGQGNWSLSWIIFVINNILTFQNWVIWVMISPGRSSAGGKLLEKKFFFDCEKNFFLKIYKNFYIIYGCHPLHTHICPLGTHSSQFPYSKTGGKLLNFLISSPGRKTFLEGKTETLTVVYNDIQ